MENLFHLFNSNLTIGEGLIYSVLGIAIVFLALILLMIVIKIMARIYNSTRKHEAPAKAPAAPLAAPVIPAAPGSAGNLTLVDVTDQEAAMIMAIVADKMGKPLNELRFKSIGEVKSDEV